MMRSEHRARATGLGKSFDFVDVDPHETARAWNRFLANRHAPSLPMTGVRSVIYQSWLRSDTTGVKPELFAAPSIERGAPISKSTYDHAELRRATRASLNQIGALLSGAEAMLILTDCNGVILDTVGDNSTLSKAGKINLSVGGVWSEDASGTNGIGTALWTGEPVYVHGEEHFCEGMKAWSCAAAPIRDPIDRSIIGIINLSGLTAIFQKHNAAFAATAARDIEIALEQEQSLLNFRLMEAIIGKLPSRVQNEGDGLAIVDRFGRMIFNRNCSPGVGGSSKILGLGAQFVNLPDGISEEKILASLPPSHSCEEIRLIDIDGEVKGAALMFRSDRPAPRRSRSLPALPGVVVPGTDLKVVGRSDAILEALERVNQIAQIKTPTLIEGQTGVGKELFARLIHSRIRSSAPFTAVNCAAVTSQMFQSRLSPQLTDTAPGDGFLCLDEIGEMPLEVQSRMLRVLENHVARRSDSDATSAAAHILSLTNRALLDEVEAGRFRRDLFYRISTIIVKIPPLCERGEDVLLIADHYNRRVSDDSGRDPLVLSSDVQEALMAHNWPGNVRELRNVITSLHYLAKTREVSLSDLPQEMTVVNKPSEQASHVNDLVARSPAATESLKAAEASLIEQVLKTHRGNLSQTAIALGISRPTLYRKMHIYGIGLSDGKHP
jgi:sigma-54 dependent transcriptional regulator, acetoin dehydrogenase operon transcriptional activator AcoR